MSTKGKSGIAALAAALLGDSLLAVVLLPGAITTDDTILPWLALVPAFH